MRFAILSNVNLDILTDILSKNNHVYRVPGFNQWEQISLDPSHSLKVFDPQMIFVILDAEFLFINIHDHDQLHERINYLSQTLLNLSRLYNTSKVYISNLDFRNHEIKPADSISTQLEILVKWNNMLDLLVKHNINIHLFDLYTFVHDFGRKNFYSNKLWYLASMPYSIEAVKTIASGIERIILNISRSRKKVLVLDLDNTLWGGVIGEDGHNGLILGDSGKGLIYKNVQLLLKKIKNTGVLLTIASKNNYEDVAQAFEFNKHMVLKFEDFVSIKCNWEHKSKNISDIASELNLGLDSFVFLDDNPLEREEVNMAIPNVTIASFPEKIEDFPLYIEMMFNDYFYIDSLTKEDLDKSNQYVAEFKRGQFQKNATNLDEFIKSLNIEVDLFFADDSNIQRISQLTQKTNQFNLLTKKYSVEEILKYIKLGNWVIAANVKDRFGNSGLVFVLMISLENNTARIDNLLMSCRVMGRKIENSIMKSVESILYHKGIKRILAQYKPTQKNSPVENLMDNLRYELKEIDNDGTKNYEKHLDDTNQIEAIFESRWSNS